MNTKYVGYFLMFLYVAIVFMIVIMLFPDNFLSAIIPGIFAAVVTGLLAWKSDFDSHKDERTIQIANKSAGIALIFFIFSVPLFLILTMGEVPMLNTGFSLLLLYFMVLSVWWLSAGYYYRKQS
ncbi:MAG: hypothetical protein PVI03_00390 [Candidatus Thorarchaeota archaeon]